MQNCILIRTMQNLKLTRPTTNTGTEKSRNKSYYKLADSSFFRREKKLLEIKFILSTDY